MADRGEPNRQGPILVLVGLAIAAFLCAVAAVGQSDGTPGEGPSRLPGQPGVTHTPTPSTAPTHRSRPPKQHRSSTGAATASGAGA